VSAVGNQFNKAQYIDKLHRCCLRWNKNHIDGDYKKKTRVAIHIRQLFRSNLAMTTFTLEDGIYDGAEWLEVLSMIDFGLDNSKVDIWQHASQRPIKIEC
jgi:hypothetical protein